MASQPGTYFEAPGSMASAIASASTGQITEGGRVSVADESGLAKVVLRCQPGSATAKHLGVTFGASHMHGSIRACGLRPDEIWLIGPVAEAKALAESLPADVGRAVVDQTHGRSMIRISGPAATGLLEKICSLDWSESMMPNGACASASVGKVSCDIVRSDEAESQSYLIACDRSFGQFLFDVLLDAGAEFGVSVG